MPASPGIARLCHNTVNLHLLDLIFLIRAAVFVTAALLILRSELRPRLVRAAASLAGTHLLLTVFVLIRMVGRHELAGLDYRFFWSGGCDVWAGLGPYDADRFSVHPFLHPPTALPLFALFALLPFESSYTVWALLTAVGGVILVGTAQRVLTVQAADDASKLSQTAVPSLSDTPILALTAALAVSDALTVTLALGQLSVLAALLLYGALGAQARDRPVSAGILLALATVKIGTMLPFLLLFLRKADRWTWIALVATTLGLCLATSGLGELPRQLSLILERIKQLEAPGMVNDYSFEGTQPENILGFEHAFYRLGMRDRTVIRLAQYAALIVLGGWLTWQVLGRCKLPRPAACSLVALYSVIFLYHRAYDTVILALPLAYATGGALSAHGSARRLFAGCAVAILLVWYINVDFLRTATALSQEWGVAGRVIQGIVLPYGTWLVLLAMLLLVRAVRAARGNAEGIVNGC